MAVWVMGKEVQEKPLTQTAGPYKWAVLHNIGSSFIHILATDTFWAPSLITFHVITDYILEADVNFMYI